MVRAPAHALSRSTGFALLKPAEKPQLDSARILTMSGTIAINLLAFGLLMMPLSMPPPAVVIDPDTGIKVRQIPKDPEVVPVVPVQQRQVIHGDTGVARHQQRGERVRIDQPVQGLVAALGEMPGQVHRLGLNPDRSATPSPPSARAGGSQPRRWRCSTAHPSPRRWP